MKNALLAFAVASWTSLVSVAGTGCLENVAVPPGGRHEISFEISTKVGF